MLVSGGTAESPVTLMTNHQDSFVDAYSSSGGGGGGAAGGGGAEAFRSG